LEAPDYMDGMMIRPILTEISNVRAKVEISNEVNTFKEAMSKAEEQEIESRLKSLGYI
jgi:hypothetical protein